MTTKLAFRAFQFTLTVSALALFAEVPAGSAQTPITPTTGSGSLNTIVSRNGDLYNITGGTRPGGGTNLFHSFGEFGVPPNSIANFLNETALPTNNILGRVTGGNISNIFGTIQTNGEGGFGNANLFLMNPAGVIFGPGATLNVGGMATFTTADYLRLQEVGETGIFYANPGRTSLLTSAPVAAFGFLGSNPGTITVQGSQLALPEGQQLSLVGGDISILEAQLAAPNGSIRLASVASPGEILAATLGQAPNVNGQVLDNLGSIEISGGAVLDTSGEGGGSVIIRGGRLLLDASLISTDLSALPTGRGIDIQIAKDAVLQNDAGLTANIFEESLNGNGGDIRLAADSILLQDSFIEAVTEGEGNAGNISLQTTNDLSINNSLIFAASFFGSGNAGNIELTSSQGSILMTTASLTTSQTFESAGNSGKINVNALRGNVFLADEAQLFTAIRGSGAGGGLEINAVDLAMTGSSYISDDNLGPAKPEGLSVSLSGTLSLSEASLIAPVSRSLTGAPAADFTIRAKDIVITEGSMLSSETFRAGHGGNLHIFAESVQLTNGGQIRSGSTIQPSPPAPRREIPSGTGGAIAIQGTSSPATSILIDGQGSGIFTTTEGTGAGGNTSISTQLLTIQNGGTISASTSGTTPSAAGGTISINTTGQVILNSGGSISASTTSPGNAGNITIQGPANPTQSVLIAGPGSGVFTATQSTGTGGNIGVSAQTVTLQNGAQVSSSSTGSGPAGNIAITANQTFAASNSSVTTEANQSSGGIIKITTDPSGTVQLSNSKISASVLDGAGGGGSVNIDPQFVILQNSQILAQAVQGAGGNIGITITNGGLFLPDATSVVSASSQFGQSGTVTIQAPIAPAGGKIQPLGKAPLQVTALLSQRCAAIARGEVSSFVVAGRDTLPTEPGGWLTSPLAFGSPEAGAAMQAEVPSVESELDNPTIVSLRRLPSSSMVAQLLGEDGLTDCAS